MAMGPSPEVIHLSKMEDGTSTLVMTCRDQGSQRPPCTIFNVDANKFDFAGSFPNNISFLITSIDSDSGGTYVATASVTAPTGFSITLSKTFTGN